jgi:peptidoglycan hydrolase-like protein with peptidoglycan-binding domain
LCNLQKVPKIPAVPLRLRPLLAAVAVVLALPLAADAKTKPLGPGSKGDAVAIMQTYLADQGFLPWTSVEGFYDYRTTQAVMAFQGWNGLSRTGTADLKTLKRLARAKRPKPWSKYHGRRIEVHVNKQVALLVNAKGKVERALHVSTGAGGRTPLGDFRIYRKETMSWSVPFSVWLPLASYITGGIAFHSYPSVPGYAASHGCIRTPAPEAPVMYAFATVRTPTHVHP